MAIEHSLFVKVLGGVGTILGFSAPVAFSWQVDGPGWLLCLLFGTLTQYANGLLFAFFPVAVQAVFGFGLVPHGFPFCPFQLLAAIWHLLRFVVSAV